jgi:hypothetical protein
MKILISAYACDPTQGSESGNGWNRAFSNAQHGHDVVCLTHYNPEKEKNINQLLQILELTNLRFIY